MDRSQKNFVEFITQLGRRGHGAFVMHSIYCLESKLESLLTLKMPRLSENKRKKFFEGPKAPLQNFSAKIDLASALAIIDSEMSCDLHALREVRNKFAHPKAMDMHLDTPEMLKLLRKFPDYDDHDGKTARIAFWQAKTIACLNELTDLERQISHT